MPRRGPLYQADHRRTPRVYRFIRAIIRRAACHDVESPSSARLVVEEPRVNAPRPRLGAYLRLSDAYDVAPAEVADLVRQVGLDVHTQLVRAAEGRESRPQASLIASKPY